MKTGIFGGAFNPFHNGHYTLMNGYLTALQLDRILLIPTADPPHKSGASFASEEDRLAMLRLIAAENEQLEVSDMEFRRTGKSYTFLTVTELKEQYPEDEFYLIIGSDQYLLFYTWYRAEELLQLVTLCTMARSEGELENMLAFREQHAELADSVIADFEIFEVSSTEIRNKIAGGESITGLVPQAIEAYIKEHGLYG